MSTKLLLRQFSIDPLTDHALEEQARQKKTQKGVLIRHYIEEGLKRLSNLNVKRSACKKTIGRSAYLTEQMDQEISHRAERLQISKGELIGLLILEGLKSDR